jgi:hypothetical protein
MIHVISGASHRYVQGGSAVMGSFSSVYNWLAHEILGGSRTPAQVRHYVENDVLGSVIRSQRLGESVGSSALAGVESGSSDESHGSPHSGSGESSSAESDTDSEHE